MRAARIPLGRYRWLLLPRTLSIPAEDARVHMHVVGKTGSGKSYFLAGLFVSLFQAGLPATLVDPHGDLAELVLTQLVGLGLVDDPRQRERLVYLDIPAAASRRRYLPFNYLAQPYDEHTLAELVAEACKRAWPELASGAPTFENVLKHAVIVLCQNRLPLTRLADLLTDAQQRNRWLDQVTDPQVVRFFRLRMDSWGKDEARLKESTLNRADLLTLSPVLRFSLGQQANSLDFRQLLQSRRSVIINLAVPAPDTRRLLGCLLTVGMEAAALSRADLPAAERVSHHLLIDEFSQFMAQSAESLTRMLSETRKYNLFCVMAHQNWSQASDRLKGALQNVGLEVILKTGRADAEYSAKLLGWVDPLAVKHTVEDHDALERTHPTYYSLAEQWERQVQALQGLAPGQAFLRLPDDRVHKVTTLRLPQVAVPTSRLQAVKEHYLTRHFREAPLTSRDPASPVGRRGPVPLFRQPVISRRG